MKTLILIGFGIVVIHSVITIDYCKIKCPRTNAMNYTVHLPGPNKTQFWKCNFGVGILFDCPPGTEFNPHLQVCDWPWRAHAVACNGTPDANSEGSGDDEDILYY